MTIMEAIKERHSVRSYTDKKIEGEALSGLLSVTNECNAESGLNIQLVLDEPTAFLSMMARYGGFKNVRNYIAIVGRGDGSHDEKCGYYGQQVVLAAQQLGLNTCWVAQTFSKSKGRGAVTIPPGQKLLMVISVGYGETQGSPHKSKPLEALCKVDGDMPDWFRAGMEAALLAPTAINQQKFRFELHGDTVLAVAGSGFYTKVDLGIAKYHFEVGAGDSGWSWADR